MIPSRLTTLAAALILVSGCASNSPKRYAAPSTAALQTRITATQSAVQSARSQSQRVESALVGAQQNADKAFALAPAEVKPVVDGVRLELKTASDANTALQTNLDTALSEGTKASLEATSLQTKIVTQTDQLNKTANDLAVSKQEVSTLNGKLWKRDLIDLGLILAAAFYFFGPQIIAFVQKLLILI